MESLVTAKEMQQADHHTINQIGIPALVLMERAALAVVEELYNNSCDLDKVAVMCGYGNNGGDGIAIARLLKLKGVDVSIYLVGFADKSSSETSQQLKIAQAYQLNIVTSLPSNFQLTQYSTIIDAIFGVGLSRPVQAPFISIIKAINQSNSRVISVDIPSGISADNGQIMGIAVKADVTIALGYKKLGLVLYPGADCAGKVIVKDIGIYLNNETKNYSFNINDVSKLLPTRDKYTNKGSFGKVLVIAGSEQMCGAAFFSAKAAYLSGAGLVRIYTPQTNHCILSTQLPESLITTYIPNNIKLEELKQAIQWASVVVLGPGMGISNDTYQILSTVLGSTNKPLIIDADGLNVLAQNMELLKAYDFPIFITPHLGEMARLIKTEIKDIQQNLIHYAEQFTHQHQITCILKDARTVVCLPNSERVYINQSGNNGMATGGSGDILTGILAGLIAQGVDLQVVAQLSVYLHSLAGDKAAQEKGQYSMIASDILDCLHQLIR